MRQVARQLQIMQSLHVSEGDEEDEIDDDISPLGLATQELDAMPEANKAPVQ